MIINFKINFKKCFSYFFYIFLINYFNYNKNKILIYNKKQIMARRSSRSHSKSKNPCSSKGMKGKRCPGKSRKVRKSSNRKASKRRSRSRSNNNANHRNMRAGAYYSFNSKDPVGGLPAVVRHADDCPSTSPQSIDFGTALYGAAKAQTGGACNCGAVANGGKRRRSGSAKRSAKRSANKKGKSRKNSRKSGNKKKGPNC